MTIPNHNQLPSTLKSIIEALDREAWEIVCENRYASVRRDATGIIQKLLSEIDETDFEALCYLLITSHHDYIGCNRNGRRGRRQDGLDIYAWSEADTKSCMLAFEVKYRKDAVDKTVLEKAIRKFEQGKAMPFCSHFTIIVSSELTADAEDYFRSHKPIFENDTGIKLDLWKSESIWHLLSRNPRVAGMFLEDAAAENLCRGYFTQAQKLIEIQEQERARAKLEQEALKKAQQSKANIQPTEPEISVATQDYDWKNNLVHLHAFLPCERHPLGNCKISLLAPGYDIVIVDMSHEQILSFFWPRHGCKYEIEERRFVRSIKAGNPGAATLQFPNSSIFTSSTVAECLCDAIDHFIPVFLEAMVKLDGAWEAEGFFHAFDRGAHEDVVLGHIPTHLWRSMIDFANEFDVDNGKGPWFMFDRAPGMFKPYNRQETDRFDSGYHAFLTVRPASDNIWDGTPPSDVELLWQPPDKYGPLQDTISKRGFWSCRQTFEWVSDELFPQMKKWAWKKLPWKTRFWLKVTGKVEDAFWDYKITNYQDDYRIELPKTPSVEQLNRVVSKLQIAYHEETHGEPFCVAAEEYKGVLEVLYRIVETSPPFIDHQYQYLCGNLRIDGTDQKSFLGGLRHKINNVPNVAVSSRSAELSFRSLGAALEYGAPKLEKAERIEIASRLEPFVTRVVEKRLVERHMPRPR